MNITSIHFKILKCLKYECYSFQELILILGIPEYKIRKHIKDLESILNVEGLDNIHKILKLCPQKNFEIKKMQSFSSNEREAYILLSFLVNEIVNLSKLNQELNVTRRTIANDINNLKKFIAQFNLNIESINSVGIKLKGDEVNKRQIFELYILRILREEKYLPELLKTFIKKINKVRESPEVFKILNYVLNNVELPSSGLAIRHIEILLSIALIRENILDLSLRRFKCDIAGDINLDIANFLALFKFCTNYEKNMIIRHCNLRNYSNILSNQKEYVEKIKGLLDIFNKEFKSSLQLEKDTIIKLYSVFKSYEFKKTFNINEFYLFKKNLSTEYLYLFNNVKKLILSYLKDIDSFDLMTISSIFIDLLNKELIKNINELNNIVIVYNFINPLIIKDLCEKLGINVSILNSKIIYINHLKYYKETNPIDCILAFENIDLSEEKAETLNFTLPITAIDRLKLKKLIYKIEIKNTNIV